MEKGKQCEEELSMQKRKIDYLFDKIEIKDSIIQIDKLQLQARANIIESYKMTEGLSEAQITGLKSNIKTLGKQVRKEKRKNFLLSTGFGLAVAGIIYILIK